jgi:hypothetical protein
MKNSWRARNSRIALFSLLIFVGCEPAESYNCFCRAITNYDVSADVQTPGGISVDSSGADIDFNAIDSDTDKTEICLGLSINRDGFNIKIAPDWYVFQTDDGRSAQVFSCDLPPSYCGNRPMCVCAGVVQPPHTIVITPNLKAYRHELIHIVAGTNSHEDTVFARCE